MIAVGSLRAQVGTILVGLEICGPQCDDAVVVGFCGSELAEEAAHGCPVEDEMCVVGREGGGLFEGLECGVLIARETEEAADRIEQQRVGSRACQRRLRRHAGFAPAPERQQALCPGEQPLRHAGAREQHAIDLRQRVRPVSLPHQSDRFAVRVDGHGVHRRCVRGVRVRRSAAAGGAMPGM